MMGADRGGAVHQATKVFDVHGHVSPPFGGLGAWLTLTLGSNAPLGDLSTARGRAVAALSGLSKEEMATTVAEHIGALAERNIDVQVTGPRPFRTLGWME